MVQIVNCSCRRPRGCQDGEDGGQRKFHLPSPRARAVEPTGQGMM